MENYSYFIGAHGDGSAVQAALHQRNRPNVLQVQNYCLFSVKACRQEVIPRIIIQGFLKKLFSGGMGAA